MIMSNTHQLQAITARKKTMEADIAAGEVGEEGRKTIG
jgi:hypothetical protein